MPINFTDFANIAPQAAPDLFGGLIEAYKKGKKFREESEAAEAQKKLVGLKTQGEELRLGALPEELEYAQWQRNFEKEHMPEERMEALQHMIRQRKNAELSGEHQAQVNKYYPENIQLELGNKRQTIELNKARTLAAIQKANQQELSVEQKEYEKAKGKGRYLASEEQAKGLEELSRVETSLNKLKSISEQDAELFKNTVGPAAKFYQYTGTPEQKRLIGDINAASGAVLLDTLTTMKGASSDREMAAVNRMKPSADDYPEAYQAKINTLLDISNTIKKRKLYILDQLQQGNSPAFATMNAINNIPLNIENQQSSHNANDEWEIIE